MFACLILKNSLSLVAIECTLSFPGNKLFTLTLSLLTQFFANFWAMLRIMDKQSAAEDKRLKTKQKKAVAKARKKMGVGQDQPSILDTLMRQATERGKGVHRLACPVSSQEGRGEGVNTHTASERNTVMGPSAEVHTECVQSSSSVHTTGSMVGEGGVITHTTSMRNIVLCPSDVQSQELNQHEDFNLKDREITTPECGKNDECVQTGSCVQPVHTIGSVKCVQKSTSVNIPECDASMQPKIKILTVCKNDVQTGPSVQPVHTTGSVKCVQSMCGQDMIMTKTSQASPSTDETPTFHMAGRKGRARFSLSKLEGGRFSLKVNSTDKSIPEGASKELSGKPGNISTSSMKHTFLKPSTHTKSDFQGGNEPLPFNNIEVIRTPKRKLKSTSAVANLISDFSAITSSLPGTGGNSESPAKRRRLWGQGGQGH